MAWTQAEIDRNRQYFAEKLQAIKQRNDVLHAVQGNSMDFILLDTRGREAFAGRSHSGRAVRSTRRTAITLTSFAKGPRTRDVLLGSRLTSLGQSGSAVGRARLLCEGDERWLERVDSAAPSDTPGKARRLALQLFEVRRSPTTTPPPTSPGGIRGSVRRVRLQGQPKMPARRVSSHD